MIHDWIERSEPVREEPVNRELEFDTDRLEQLPCGVRFLR